MLICHLWNSLISLGDSPVARAPPCHPSQAIKVYNPSKSSRIDVSGDGDGDRDGDAARDIWRVPFIMPPTVRTSANKIRRRFAYRCVHLRIAFVSFMYYQMFNIQLCIKMGAMPKSCFTC